MTVSSAPIIVWFRRDLRLHDNPALWHAAETGRPVLPVFIRDAIVDTMGAAARWRLGLALDTLDQNLRAAGSRLILMSGNAHDCLNRLASQTGATRLHYGRDYGPDTITRDQKIKSQPPAGLDVESFRSALLFEPWTVTTGTGGYYKVYSPFWRAVAARDPGMAIPVPERLAAPKTWPDSEALTDWSLGAGMRRGAAVVERHMQVGEAAALDRLARFVETRLEDYKSDRERMDQDATSGLSENLAYGEISPRVIWHRANAAHHLGVRGAEHFMKELVWREFSYHLYFHTPHIASANWRDGWDRFPWRCDVPEAEAWRRGETGEPIIDAAMRELYVTGRMHNRARMIVASYLTKHLMVHWRVGQAWFADCLADWDPASNALGWQWVAGCGPDAAPYFRVFNPALQAEKFDPDGRYRAHYLDPGGEGARDFAAATPLSWKIAPAAPRPAPIVELKAGRERALAAYKGFTDSADVQK